MESTDPPQTTAMAQHAAKYGVILAACSIVLVVLFYIINLCFLGTFKFLGLALAMGLGMVIYSGIMYRNENGGYLTYGKAFFYGLILLAVSGFISMIFNMILYQIVDPEFPQKLTDCIVANTEEMMRNFGAPEGSIEETTNKMKDEMPGNFTYGGLAFGYVKALPWYIGVSLITALFVRRNEPVEL